MHLLAVVLIPFNANHAAIRPLVARDAAVDARLDTLMFRYQQPDDDWVWGVDPSRGFIYDWWTLGGRWRNWGRTVRTLMRKQRQRPTRRAIPRFIEHYAVWSQDLLRVRPIATHLPDAIVTPHGEWNESSMLLLGGNSVRERKAKAAWLKKIRKIVHAYPDCLAVGVDYHC